jgi:multiple sugar transport system substrate-binding protein
MQHAITSQHRTRGFVLLSTSAACALLAGALWTTPAFSQQRTLKVGYSSTYVFDEDAESAIYWNQIKKEFEAAHPGVTLELQPHGGNDVDEMNAIALQYRSPSTAPDVIQLPTTYIGQFQSSGYLLPLDRYLGSSNFWNNFPKNIQDEGRIESKVYAVDIGENNTGIYYNKDMLQKAGIALPWRPHNWNDILTAARAVKEKVPGVIPLWVAAGTSAGPTGVLQGSGALVYSSSTPVIYDTKTQKYVTDSPGLREVLQFYKDVYSAALGAPLSDLFSPKAVAVPVSMMAQKKLAIAIGSNWYGGAWKEKNRYWANASSEADATPLPTSKAQPPGQGGTLGGWDMAVSKSTRNPDLAWALIQLIQQPKYMIFIANKAGFVPPDVNVAKAPDYVNYAPPFNAAFGTFLPYDKLLPSNAGFAVWARGIEEATGRIAQDPNTLVPAAIKILQDTVENQLGPDQVENMH